MPLSINEKQATEFIDYVAKNIDKLKKHLAVSLGKHKISNAFDGDDILQDTIMDVHASITRNGLTEGTHYNAYLNTSLNNAILKFKQKRDKNLGLHSSLEFLFESEESDDEATPVAQVLLQASSDDDDEDEVRRNHPFQPYSPFTEPRDYSEASKNAHQKAVLATFDTLPSKYREILWMVANGLKYKEIARALNLTIGQVKMRVKSGRDLIKAQHNIYPDAE